MQEKSDKIDTRTTFVEDMLRFMVSRRYIRLLHEEAHRNGIASEQCRRTRTSKEQERRATPFWCRALSRFRHVLSLPALDDVLSASGLSFPVDSLFCTVPIACRWAHAPFALMSFIVFERSLSAHDPIYVEKD